MPISCHEVRRELANYMEDDISPELRVRIDRHFQECDGCFVIYDGLNVVRLIDKTEIIELPEGFSIRLYQRIVTHSVLRNAQ
jgi:predicted anti-sigma-YlaC factor YlaD